MGLHSFLRGSEIACTPSHLRKATSESRGSFDYSDRTNRSTLSSSYVVFFGIVLCVSFIFLIVSLGTSIIYVVFVISISLRCDRPHSDRSFLKF